MIGQAFNPPVVDRIKPRHIVRNINFVHPACLPLPNKRLYLAVGILHSDNFNSCMRATVTAFPPQLQILFDIGLDLLKLGRWTQLLIYLRTTTIKGKGKKG